MRTYAESGGKRDALVADCLVPPLLKMLSPPHTPTPTTASTDDSESDSLHIAAASEVLGQVSAISEAAVTRSMPALLLLLAPSYQACQKSLNTAFIAIMQP
jgi:hypothetical protein